MIIKVDFNSINPESAETSILKKLFDDYILLKHWCCIAGHPTGLTLLLSKFNWYVSTRNNFLTP